MLKSLCFLSKLRMCWHLQHLSDRSCDKLKSTSNSRCPFDSYIINIIQNTIFIIIFHIIKIDTIMFYYQQGDHKDEITTGQEFKSPLSPVQLSQVKCKLKPGPILSSVWYEGRRDMLNWSDYAEIVSYQFTKNNSFSTKHEYGEIERMMFGCF